MISPSWRSKRRHCKHNNAATTATLTLVTGHLFARPRSLAESVGLHFRPQKNHAPISPTLIYRGGGRSATVSVFIGGRLFFRPTSRAKHLATVRLICAACPIFCHSPPCHNFPLTCLFSWAAPTSVPATGADGRAARLPKPPARIWRIWGAQTSSPLTWTWPTGVKPEWAFQTSAGGRAGGSSQGHASAMTKWPPHTSAALFRRRGRSVAHPPRPVPWLKAV